MNGKKSPRQRRKALVALAHGTDAYDEAYRNTMLRIFLQLLDQKDLAIQTLTWVVHARRPLTTIELRHALSVEVGEREFFEDNMPNIQDTISACCGLVTIDEESDNIRLIHSTAQELFERRGIEYFLGAHIQITNTCVTYLSFDVFDIGPCSDERCFARRLAQFPLYEIRVTIGAIMQMAERIPTQSETSYLSHTKFKDLLRLY